MGGHTMMNSEGTLTKYPILPTGFKPGSFLLVKQVGAGANHYTTMCHL